MMILNLISSVYAYDPDVGSGSGGGTGDLAPGGGTGDLTPGGGTGDLTPPAISPPDINLSGDIFDILANIASFITRIALPLAGIMILWAGFLFLTSGGVPEKIKLAQKTLIYTVVGYIIILVSSSLMNLIRNLLTSS